MPAGNYCRIEVKISHVATTHHRWLWASPSLITYQNPGVAAPPVLLIGPFVGPDAGRGPSLSRKLSAPLVLGDSRGFVSEFTAGPKGSSCWNSSLATVLTA